MRLTQRETDRLMIHAAGELAKSRKNRGLKLNYPEAIAFITSELLEMARDGMSVQELMRVGGNLLDSGDVMDGVADMVREVQLEATFPDGTKLVTVHEPIKGISSRIPGEFIFNDEDDEGEEGEITLNVGKDSSTVTVTNTGDRPIQVGSHFHFFEANRALRFNRNLAWGMRLDIPSGTAVRFEPGQTRRIELIEIGGDRIVSGFNGLVEGSLDSEGMREAALARARQLGFLDEESGNGEKSPEGDK